MTLGEMPDLGVEVVDDDERLGEAVDAVLQVLRATNPEIARTREEHRVQEELLLAVWPAAWQQYLRVEELKNAEFADLAVLIARWAFIAGVDAARRPGGSP